MLTKDQRERQVKKTKENAAINKKRKKKFGQLLNGYLASEQITQKQLAEETGIDDKQISKYVNGKNLPKQHNFLKIMKHMIKCEEVGSCPILKIKDTIE